MYFLPFSGRGLRKGGLSYLLHAPSVCSVQCAVYSVHDGVVDRARRKLGAESFPPGANGWKTRPQNQRHGMYFLNVRSSFVSGTTVHSSTKRHGSKDRPAGADSAGAASAPCKIPCSLHDLAVQAAVSAECLQQILSMRWRDTGTPT